MSDSLSSIITDLIKRKDLDQNQARYLMEEILNGRAKPSEIAAIITLLRSKGETPLELSNIVKTMWENCPKIPEIDSSELIDTCGTGGDNSGSINISTASALVLATAGVKVAKHGNKAASSKCGAADVLTQLGVKIDLDPVASVQMINETNFAFLYAPVFHPGMRHAAPIRAELGVRTSFNFLGPLSNPFKAQIRLHGVSDPDLVIVYAETLKLLGVTRAFVFCGHNCLDELSLSGKNEGILLEDSQLRELTIDPELFGFRPSQIEEIQGGDAKQNAEILQKVFSGNFSGPYEDIIVLNAGVALDLVKRQGIEASIDEIRAVIKSGEVKNKLEQIVEFSHRL